MKRIQTAFESLVALLSGPLILILLSVACTPPADLVTSREENSQTLPTVIDKPDGIQEHEEIESDRVWGFLDATGNVAIPLVYEHARRFSGGLSAVKLDGFYGYIDRTGEMRIQPSFIEADLFAGGKAIVKTAQDLYGVIDTSGDFIIAPSFDYVERFADGLAMIRVDERCGYIDSVGGLVIEPQYELCTSFSEGVASVFNGERWQFIDPQGRPFLSGFGDTASFECGVARVWLDNQDVLLRKDGSQVTLPEGMDWYSRYCDNNRIEVARGDRYGYLDTDGQIAIEIGFESARTFRNGQAIVGFNGRLGLIDTNGNWLLNPKYDDLHLFNEGLAYAETPESRGFIDASGGFVFETEVEVADYFSEGLVPVFIEVSRSDSSE